MNENLNYLSVQLRTHDRNVTEPPLLACDFETKSMPTQVDWHIYGPGNGIYIVSAHTDSPCLKLKLVSKVSKGCFLEVGVQCYGGALWHTRFDRDLSIAGSVIIKEQENGSESCSHRLIRIEEPIMRIPTLAIHLDRNVIDGFEVNKQSHLAPVLATSVKTEINKPAAENGPSAAKNTDGIFFYKFLCLISADCCSGWCEPDDICDFELQACDTQKSAIAGAMKEFIFSGRLDNLCMSFCTMKSPRRDWYKNGSLV